MAQLTTIDEFRLAAPIRLLNRFGLLFDRLNWSPVDLSASAVFEDAVRRTGLANWGDQNFLSDYEALISAFEHHLNLSLLGILGTQRDFRRMLTNRLYVQEALKRNPEILDIPVTRPLFILGLPRTGTTLLHKLLAQDHRFRVPPLWQLMAPLPLSDQPPQKQRIKEAEQYINLANYTAPLMRAMHEISAHEPEECIFLLPHHLSYHLRAQLPGYRDWQLSRDTTPEYRYYKQQLQCLAYQKPDARYAMKSPFHLFSLKALLSVFPDACIIQTHRDLKRVIPSWCSLGAGLQTLHLKQVDRYAIGSDWLRLWKTALERSLAARQSIPAGQFFDLHYTDLFADPIAAVQRIYQHFDYTWDADVEARMRAWLAATPQDKHGAHRYSAAQFGLTETGIRQTFKTYTDQFNIQLES